MVNYVLTWYRFYERSGPALGPQGYLMCQRVFKSHESGFKCNWIATGAGGFLNNKRKTICNLWFFCFVSLVLSFLFAANLILQTQGEGSERGRKGRREMGVHHHRSSELCTCRKKLYHHIWPCSSFKAKWGFPGAAAKGNSSYGRAIL